MSDSSTGVKERHNQDSEVLKLGDGMGVISSGAMVVTDEKHLAVRNAIESHRLRDRPPLSIDERHLHTGSDQ